MSEIIERKESQNLIDVYERKVVFDDGHEIHEVVVCMGETQFSFNRHLTSDNTVSKHQGVSIHRMNETEITIFDKVSKQYKKFKTFGRTKIQAVSE